MSTLEPPDAPVGAPGGDEPSSPGDDAADEPDLAAPVGPAASELPGVSVMPDVPEELEGDGVEEQLAQYPPVVAVVVTRNPGPWLEDTLASLGGQDYDDLTILVVDCGSREDPTPRVAAVLPRAFVRRLDDGAGFAAAANEALHAVEGATFLLLCHDDVVLDPSALRLLVEEGYRSNAGIAGPKLVRADNPEVLLEVGRSVDRFGAPFTGIEPGELDQEQHDGVRDVFYVSTAVMLVRTDLFEELEGFDPATFPGAEDLDLCWRARLAGARVLVVPDARATHREAATDRLRDDRPDEFALARSRVRVLFTSYSFHKLLWLVPVGFVVGFVEALGDLLTGHPRRARAAIGSWFSNLIHVRSLRASRRRAQSLRTVHDSELRELQVSSTARLNAFLAHHLHTDTRLRNLGDASRSAVDSVSDGIRTPAAIAFLAFLALVVLGSRSLISSGVPAIGTFAHWPGVGDAFDAFGSAWRYTGLGSASPAPAALALIGASGTVLLGATGLAQTLVVVVAMPLGAFGAYRLSRYAIGFRGPALAAGLAYGINPAVRNALAQGRLGPLVLFALLPFVLLRVVRLGDRSDARRGRVLRLTVLLALLGAFYPAGLGLVVLAVAAFVVAVPIAGGARAMVRALGLAIVAALGALVLLFPWPLAYAHEGVDKAALGFAFRPDLDLSQVLRFDSGPAAAGWAMWGLVIAAAVPLFVATGDRLAWAARGWVLALIGWAVVWVPARWFPDTSVLAPEAGLTLAALGLALCVGIAVSVFVEGIHTFRFGWRQPAAIIGAVAVVLPALAFTSDVFDGRWDAPSAGWANTLEFTEGFTSKGEFRMLWAGDPAELPLDPVVMRDGTGYVLTRNGPGDVTEQWRAPEHDADHVVDRALALAAAGRTNRLGRMLAPMGVRFVVVPSTQGRDGGAAASAPVAFRRAMAQQLDLARLRTSAGLVLYENLAYAPILASVPPPRLPVDSPSPNRAAQSTDLTRATPLTGDAAAGTVLWGEAYDGEWRASADGDALRHQQAFGWANSYVVDRRTAVSLAYEAQWVRWAMLAGALVIWVLVVWRWRRTRVRRAPVVRADTRSRRERRLRPDPLAELDDEAYWWERV
jgi:GT2 family glycosyltransferase